LKHYSTESVHVPLIHRIG